MRHTGRFLVGGIAVMASGYVGLLVGARVGGELRYLGCVEWGRTAGRRGRSHTGAQMRADSPFADLRRRREGTWLAPRLIAEVR
jgi:hypothetical protein